MAKKSAVYKDYTINREDNDSITVYKNDELCSNSMEAMKEIAKQCGFTIDENWNTRQIGNKLISFLNNTNEAIVRIKETCISMIGFDVPCLEDDEDDEEDSDEENDEEEEDYYLDEGDEYVTFCFPLGWDDEFEVEVNGKISTYTLKDCVPEGVDIKEEYYGNEWYFFEDSDKTTERCFDDEWEEVEGEEYDDETLEYTIPLKDGEEFDIKKLRFEHSGDYIHCYPSASNIIYDGKKIEESSGVIDSYLS